MTNIPVSPAESPEIEAPPPIAVVELMKEQAYTPFNFIYTRLNLPSSGA
jgi:hypothetical protein